MLIDIDAIPNYCFTGPRVGLEKEGLRVYKDGNLSTDLHPEVFGSPLTHQSITTDFSESLLELVTPPCWSSKNALNHLHKLQTFVHRFLSSNEIIWTSSMPCHIDNEDDIRIAQYGTSEHGMMKTIYRRGLAKRYGKMMQLISGIHFNYSFSEEIWSVLHEQTKCHRDMSFFTSDRYMSTIRNIQRYDWLLLYLFGASPAASRSFQLAEDRLQQFDKSTQFKPYATSLRMSDIGYTNKNEGNQTFINHKSLHSYINTLDQATKTPNLNYEHIGIFHNGRQQQLNANELQIENEYYSSVRPKQIPHRGESNLNALQNRGIRYLELRSIDINPFTPTGLHLQQLHFLEIFINYCLLRDSKEYSRNNAEMNRSNLNQTAFYGRDPCLKLSRESNKVKLQDWAEQLFDGMIPIAVKMDETNPNDVYSQALTDYLRLVKDSTLTPSAQVLHEMRINNEGHTDFILRKSLEHHQYLQTTTLDEESIAFYKALSRQSIRQLQNLEIVKEEASLDTHLNRF